MEIFFSLQSASVVRKVGSGKSGLWAGWLWEEWAVGWLAVGRVRSGLVVGGVGSKLFAGWLWEGWAVGWLAYFGKVRQWAGCGKGGQWAGWLWGVEREIFSKLLVIERRK